MSDKGGLMVVEVKCIKAVVSIQPHEHRIDPGDERFFVWEQIGLDMSLLIESEEEEQ